MHSDQGEGRARTAACDSLPVAVGDEVAIGRGAEVLEEDPPHAEDGPLEADEALHGEEEESEEAEEYPTIIRRQRWCPRRLC